MITLRCRWMYVCGAVLAAGGCSGPVSVHRSDAPSPPPALTKEDVHREGMRLFGDGLFDSAAVRLAEAAAMDSTWLTPLRDLARLRYDRTMRLKEPGRVEEARRARAAYMTLEARGTRDEDLYERICELSGILDDQRTLVRYAEKDLALHPFERQYYNAGVAYARAGDHGAVVRTQREAIDRFPSSLYAAGYYRLLGAAYKEMNRDQTAERTFTAGVKAADALAARLQRSDPAFDRVLADRRAMLLALKKLHQTYGNGEKLKEVERQLKEADHGS